MDRHAGGPGVRLELATARPGRSLRAGGWQREIRCRLCRRLDQGDGGRPLRPLTTKTPGGDITARCPPSFIFPQISWGGRPQARQAGTSSARVGCQRFHRNRVRRQSPPCRAEGERPVGRKRFKRTAKGSSKTLQRIFTCALNEGLWPPRLGGGHPLRARCAAKPAPPTPPPTYNPPVPCRDISPSALRALRTRHTGTAGCPCARTCRACP